MSSRGKKGAQRREAILVGVVALLCIFAGHGIAARGPLASAESRFTEESSRGFNIIPASCPSSPHYLGECSTTGYSQGSYGGYSQGTYSTTYSQSSYGFEGYAQSGYDGTAPSCAPSYFCNGNDLFYRSEQCVASLVQTCPFGCFSGACLPPPPGQGQIIVHPSLIRSGETTTVSWTTEAMVEDSCAVTEDSASIADQGTGPEGSFVSSPIIEQTTYTLSCMQLDGDSFTDTATVGVTPFFEEN